MPRRRRTKWLKAARGDPGGFRPGQKPDWIGRALARAGVLPREAAEAAVHAGRVTIAGRQVKEPLALVRAGDEVRLDGRAVSLAAPTIVLAFHKPAGVVTALADAHGGGTVFDGLAAALPDELRGFGWHAVGRLDRDTTGLLLFTNDERVVEHVTSPRTHLPKRYVAHVQGTATEEKLEPLRRGIVLEDGPARPAKVRLRAVSEVELVISEGRHHQVKRMLGAVGLPVRVLRREAIGGVELDVPEGELRRLTHEEVTTGLGFSPPSG